MTLITGNTYPVREQIKALGGRWNPDQKGWMVPEDRANEARQLVSGAPQEHRRSWGNGHTRNRGCSCNEHGCCRPRCHCGPECNCRGGPIYDC